MTPTRPREASRTSGLLYKDIAMELRRRIAEGDFPPGSKLPGLRELVREFSVSTITIRRALTELTSEGLIYGQQGLGVFIKPKRTIHRLLAADPDSSIGDEIRRAGFDPHFEEREFARAKADSTIAARLAIRAGTTLYRHEKITFADNEILSLHILHIPSELALQLREGLTRQFIFRLLKEQKVEYARSRFEFASMVTDQSLSPIFGLPVGFPLLRVGYTPMRDDGTPLLTGSPSVAPTAGKCTASSELTEDRSPADAARLLEDERANTYFLAAASTKLKSMNAESGGLSLIWP